MAGLAFTVKRLSHSTLVMLKVSMLLRPGCAMHHRRISLSLERSSYWEVWCQHGQ